MKTLISLALVASLILLPVSSTAQDAPAPSPQNQPQSLLPVLCGVLVLIAGTVILIELYKMCKRLPPIEEPDPETNAPVPPVVPPGYTNITLLPSGPFTITCTDADLRYHKIMNVLPLDTNGPVVSPWLLYSAVDFFTSTNLRDWSCDLSYTQWISGGGALFVFATNGVTFLTNYSPAYHGVYTNIVPVPLMLPPGDRQRFLRAKSY